MKARLGVAVAVIVFVNILVLSLITYPSLMLFGNSRKSRHDQILSPDSNSWLERIQTKVQVIRMFLNNSSPTSPADNPGNKLGHYILLDNRTCGDSDVIDVVLLVHTAPKHATNRQRIRQSFSQRPSFLPFQVRTAFLLGQTPSKTLQAQLRQEHFTYRDLVMGEFLDSYHNLTLKGVMGYHWVSQHCSNARVVLKIDDDIIVNMYKFLDSLLEQIASRSKSIFCNLWRKNTMQIQRKGKWKVEANIFYNKQVYPYDYCSGFVVAMTTDLMKPMYEAAKATPFFWVDDVYLFGMLPKVVGGVHYFNYALDQNLTLNGKEALRCARTEGAQCPIFASFVSKKEYWRYWNLIEDIYTRDWKTRFTSQ